MDKNSTFLVTGGAGFIGSNICRKLLSCGYNVVCMDIKDEFIYGEDFFSGSFIKPASFKYIKGDICSYSDCVEACKGVDYVLHQAALCSVPESISNPTEYYRVNVGGTVNMLNAARLAHVKRFVYASSSSVYGNVAGSCVEGCESVPLSPYAVSKKCCEEIAQNFTKVYDFPTVGLRYFNVFGKYQNAEGPYASVIPKFITQLLSGHTPIIYGDGRQSRDFTPVENVVEANILACEEDYNASGPYVFNVGTGQSYTVNEVYFKICELLSIDLDPIYEKVRAGDIKHSLSSIRRIEMFLGYDGEVGFDEALFNTVMWYKNKFDSEVQ